MEHYDGPAFFRKFAVKPSPEQLEDTTAERSQRSVKQRRERNDRLRGRERQETGRQQRQQSQPTPTERPQSAASAAAKPVTNSHPENYRPFQVTPIPKQLHWSHPTSESRRRYRRLIASLEKTDQSFLLFGAADERDEPTTPTVASSANSSATMTTPATETPVTAPDTARGTSESATATVSATSSAAAPKSKGANRNDSSTTLETTQSATSATTPVATESSAPVASTEVFYPHAAASTEATATQATDASATSAIGGAGDYLPVGTVKSADRAVETSVTNAAPTSERSASSASATSSSAPVADQSATEPATSATSPVRSAAMVRSTAHLVVSSAAGVPASVASTSHQPAVTADSAAHRVSTSVADLSAQSAPDTATAVSASTSAAATSTAPATTQRPAEVNQLLDRAQDDQPSSVASTKPKAKAKPTRGLGHSLGDIMQEEGNDQRNLALFDRPSTPAVAAEEADDQPTRGYHFPDVSLLPKPVVPDEAALDEWIEHQAEVLDATLSAFHVDAHVTDWTVGPTVTQFQISLALGVKVNKITNLNDDLKLALAAKDIRIEAPIPGKTTVGIEIPNVKSRPVMLSEILNSSAFKNSESPLTVALGVDLFGQPQVTDLRKMPHGLIAGATGSGKSVFINSLLLSILYKATPAQVKLLLIDPKAVEMAPYDGLPHLLSPVISDPKAAAAALKWVVTEMDQRYEKLAAAGVRNIEQFNDRADANDEPSLKMPYIVIIIDELADLMMMAASEVQDYIVRITQKARAAGIHLLVATQRPSVDIVTGTIKNNIPTRIAFMVSSQIDSRTILDTAGAESLLGRGDMLYLGNGASQPMRLQGAFVESEVDAITDFVRTQGKPHYAFEPKGLLQRETAEENQDELLPKVLDYIAQEKTVSTSKLQRVFSIGYNRAANLIDDLEQRHYVSSQHGSKPREVYLTPDDLGKDLPEPHDKDAPSSL
ncbi:MULTISPECIES: DNA translocase FtsK [Lactobacillaceae]|uniref:DNA translocase FtsK n=1 Tax=Lactobacillaceae TaxID=33958 RepID=UPI0014569729|nr:DNA translocase FtsK [Lactobacillus sp. HBUAS51381]NLR10546.1 DUF87 domain-containing protein [Lactobacillus sp. HBUAS51381]